MTGKASFETMLLLPVGVVLLAIGAWWWRASVFHSQEVRLPGERWEQVKRTYPLPQEIEHAQTVSSQMADVILQANPFSAKRREAPPRADGGAANGGQGGEPIPPPAKFIYKGHINLGKRQRAIVEDVNNHKTHFLEAGQEVAGFKVLDISENRVVLSDLQTNEEVVLSLTAPPSP